MIPRTRRLRGNGFSKWYTRLSEPQAFLNFIYTANNPVKALQKLHKLHIERAIYYKNYFMAKIYLSRENTHRSQFPAIDKCIGRYLHYYQLANFFNFYFVIVNHSVVTRLSSVIYS